MKIKDIIRHLELYAPLIYQESYDNSGLVFGDRETKVNHILLTLDVTEEVIKEAEKKSCNLIIAHHPIVFKGVKKLDTQHYVNRILIQAIKKDIALYAIHTNLDNTSDGVNARIATQLGLVNTSVLQSSKHTLLKLVTFVPKSHKDQVCHALYNAGAGHIGAYSHCSFQIEGKGSFKPNNHSNPYVGKVGKLEEVEEVRLELILPKHTIKQVIHALKQAHPYEEVAYYLHTTENQNQEIGSGMFGYLEEPMPTNDFFKHLKKSMNLIAFKHTPICKTHIYKVALCGGAGSFLLQNAIAKQADIFISSDFKYHEFFDADGKVIIADIGHYESEYFTKYLLKDKLSELVESSNLLISEVNTNPVHFS